MLRLVQGKRLIKATIRVSHYTYPIGQVFIWEPQVSHLQGINEKGTSNYICNLCRSKCLYNPFYFHMAK